MTIRLLTPENLIPSLTSCHSARRASLPEVAESTVSKCEGKICPLGEGACQGGWGVGESALPCPSPTVCNGPLLSWRTRVIYWMMDSATPPCGWRRMTAYVEMSEIQMEMKEVFSPLLVEQALLTWLDLFLSSTKTEVGCVLSHISHHIFLGVTGFAHLSSIH